MNGNPHLGPDSDMTRHDLTIREFVNIIVEEQKVLWVTTLIAVVLALTYVFIAPKVYEAKATYYSADESDFGAFNRYNEVASVTQEQIYKLFLRNIDSYSNKVVLFKQLNIAEHHIKNFKDLSQPALVKRKKAALRGFIRHFKLTLPKKDFKAAIQNEKPVMLTYKDKDPELAVAVVNGYTQLVNKAIVNEINNILETKIRIQLEQVERKIKSLRQLTQKKRLDEISRIEESDAIKKKDILLKIDTLRAKAKRDRYNKIIVLEGDKALAISRINDKIDALRVTMEQKRKDAIAGLQEQINIAKQLGIKDRTPLQAVQTLNAHSVAGAPSTILTQITTQQTPRYFLGEKALTAEIEQLKKRKDNDAFAAKLRDLQRQRMEQENDQQIAVLRKRQNDDPYIEELSDLQRSLVLTENNHLLDALQSRANDDPYIPDLPDQLELQGKLSSIRFDLGKVKTFKIDEVPISPLKPVSPKVWIIVPFVTGLGLILGLFLSFICYFYKQG